MYEYENYLVHHGILGQKWGKRNGPPYPIDAQDHSASEKKAGWRKSLSNGREEVRSAKEKTLNSNYYEQTVLSTKGKDGSLITIKQLKRSGLQKIIARGFKHAYKEQMNTKNFEIKISEKRIGDLQLYQESPTSINVTWIGVNSKERGKGYATACLIAAAHECKKRGYKSMTLEVPGDSPDARHIYEKLGFVAHEQISDEDDVWGGLTAMSMNLNNFNL